VDNAFNHDLKFLKKSEKEQVILIVKEKWVGLINCRFSNFKFWFNLKFDVSRIFFHVKSTQNLHMDLFYKKYFKFHLSMSNVHQSLFLKLKRILILIIKITTWIEIGEIYVCNTFWCFWFIYAFGHEKYEFWRCV
jgi:hypothetical protein